jgi:hypothetical protein
MNEHIEYLTRIAQSSSLLAEKARRELTRLGFPVTKGDVEGHEFHGNQWTGGEGGGSSDEPRDWTGARTTPGTAGPGYSNGLSESQAGQLEERFSPANFGTDRPLTDERAQAIATQNQVSPDDVRQAYSNMKTADDQRAASEVKAYAAAVQAVKDNAVDRAPAKGDIAIITTSEGDHLVTVGSRGSSFTGVGPNGEYWGAEWKSSVTAVAPASAVDTSRLYS